MRSCQLACLLFGFCVWHQHWFTAKRWDTRLMTVSHAAVIAARSGHIISLLLPHRGQCRERNLEIFISIPSLALLLISLYFSCYKLHYSNALHKLLCCNISSKSSVLGKKTSLILFKTKADYQKADWLHMLLPFSSSHIRSAAIKTWFQMDAFKNEAKSS